MAAEADVSLLTPLSPFWPQSWLFQIPYTARSDPELTCFEQHLQSVTVLHNEAGHCPGPGLASPLGAFSPDTVTRKRGPQAHREGLVCLSLCHIKLPDPPESPLTSPKNSPWLSTAPICWEWQLSWQQQYALKCQVKSFHCPSESSAEPLKCTIVQRCVHVVVRVLDSARVASCVHLYSSMWAEAKELSLPFSFLEPLYILSFCADQAALHL